MDHEAYAFNWDAFAIELLPVLQRALETDDRSELVHSIEANREQLTDTSDGHPLTVNWRAELAVADLQVLGDYALTRFYDPAQLSGVGEAWVPLSDALPGDAQAALLGSPIGGASHWFDPGRMGSYF